MSIFYGTIIPSGVYILKGIAVCSLEYAHGFGVFCDVFAVVGGIMCSAYQFIKVNIEDLAKFIINKTQLSVVEN